MHESLCINRGFVYIQMDVATSYCTETRLTNVPIFSAKDNLYTLQVAALAPLALLEARYAHLVIAHLMVILWRSTCTHTAHMHDGKTCNDECHRHDQALQWEQWYPCPRWKATGLCWMCTGRQLYSVVEACC